MAYINGTTELSDLLQHPLVQPLLDSGKVTGLAGGTKVDYLLGIVEQAVDINKDNQDATAVALREKYQSIRDQNPRRYSSGDLHRLDGKKNPAYCAHK